MRSVGGLSHRSARACGWVRLSGRDRKHHLAPRRQSVRRRRPVISLDCGMRAHMLPNILENCVAIAATAASRAFFLCASCSIFDAERALWASLGARHKHSLSYKKRASPAARAPRAVPLHGPSAGPARPPRATGLFFLGVDSSWTPRKNSPGGSRRCVGPPGPSFAMGSCAPR